MSRISGLRNDMNKRTFYKERKINNRCFDFLSKQNMIVPLILDINDIRVRNMCKLGIMKLWKVTLERTKPTCFPAVGRSDEAQLCFFLWKLAVQQKLIILYVKSFSRRIVRKAVKDSCKKRICEKKLFKNAHTSCTGSKHVCVEIVLTRDKRLRVRNDTIDEFVLNKCSRRTCKK